MAIEFDLDGHEYRCDKLTAMQQFHVSRKIAPLIPAAIGPFLAISAMHGADKHLEKLISELQPLADGLSALPDADAEFVLNTCLGVVRRKQGETWAPVWNSTHKVTMFEDIDLGVLIRLAMRVIIESLGPFIKGAVTSLQQKATDSKA